MRVSQRLATVEEGAALARDGTLSETVRMRAMAQPVDGGAPILVTLKAVDDAWPLVGRFALAPHARTTRPHGLQAAIAPALADRMGLHVGDALRIGAARLAIIGIVANEPDKLGEGFSLGPLVLVDRTGLDATGLVQPGSLYESRYRLRLLPGADAQAIGDAFVRRFPDSGWTVHTPAGAAGNLRQAIAQLGQFLLLVGLAALAIAGVGVGSGVSAYLAGKTRIIATLKVLGARSGTIAAMFLIELCLVAGGGIVAGLALGAAVPAIIAAVAGDVLPVPPRLGLYPAPLLVATGLGLLVALLFALPALARARSVPAATLLRDAVARASRPSLGVVLGMALLLAVLVALAVLTASDRAIALGFVGATSVLILLLWLVGLMLRFTLARLPKPRRPLLRLALANLHRPGAPTDRLGGGTGSGLLAVRRAGDHRHKSRRGDAGRCARQGTAFLRDRPPAGRRHDIPRRGHRRRARRADRGRAVAARRDHRVEGPPRRRHEDAPRWRLDPEGRPHDHLVRDAAAAQQHHRRTLVARRLSRPPAHLARGQGRRDARPAYRRHDHRLGARRRRCRRGSRPCARSTGAGSGSISRWSSRPAISRRPRTGCSPSVYAPAGRDGAISRAVADTLPSVSMIRTGDLIGTISDLLGHIAVAIRAAAAVTVAAGIVVLIGTVTASAQARRYDIAVLKLLGARRRQLLLGQTIEYALLATLLALVALGVGSGGGWYVVTQLFGLPWAPDWTVVAATLAASIVATLGIGLAASLSTLSARPSATLRSGLALLRPPFVAVTTLAPDVIARLLAIVGGSDRRRDGAAAAILSIVLRFAHDDVALQPILVPVRRLAAIEGRDRRPPDRSADLCLRLRFCVLVAVIRSIAVVALRVGIVRGRGGSRRYRRWCRGIVGQWREGLCIDRRLG